MSDETETTNPTAEALQDLTQTHRMLQILRERLGDALDEIGSVLLGIRHDDDGEWPDADALTMEQRAMLTSLAAITVAITNVRRCLRDEEERTWFAKSALAGAFEAAKAVQQ